MANANKKIISKGKATEEKEKKPSKSPVTVEVVDGVFVFHGGKGGHNITERKNKALEPYGKCIYNYGLLLELIPGDQTSPSTRTSATAGMSITIIWLNGSNIMTSTGKPFP